MKIEIKQAKPDHAQDWANIHVNSWRAAYKGIIPDDILDNLSFEKSAERFKRLLEKAIAKYLIMYADDKPAGLLVYSSSNDEDTDDKTADIGALYFLPEYWGKGLSRKLVDYSIDEIKNEGYTKLNLWVLEENCHARKFYEKCGFVPDGTNREITLGKPLPEVRYKMELD